MGYILPPTLFNTVKEASISGDFYNAERTKQDVFSHVVEEVGELSTEIMIADGRSYKQPGADGVVGEGVDIILAVLDLIHVYDPSITEEQIVELARLKCKKWINSLIDHPIKKA